MIELKGVYWVCVPMLKTFVGNITVMARIGAQICVFACCFICQDSVLLDCDQAPEGRRLHRAASTQGSFGCSAPALHVTTILCLVKVQIKLDCT